MCLADIYISETLLIMSLLYQNNKKEKQLNLAIKH